MSPNTGRMAAIRFSRRFSCSAHTSRADYISTSHSIEMFPAIALGGGGVRGFLLVGALQRLAQVQKLEFPQGI